MERKRFSEMARSLDLSLDELAALAVARSRVLYNARHLGKDDHWFEDFGFGGVVAQGLKLLLKAGKYVEECPFTEDYLITAEGRLVDIDCGVRLHAGSVTLDSVIEEANVFGQDIHVRINRLMGEYDRRLSRYRWVAKVQGKQVSGKLEVCEPITTVTAVREAKRQIGVMTGGYPGTQIVSLRPLNG